MIDAILTGVFTKFTGSTLATALTNRMYSRYAPQNTVFPYAVVDATSGIADWTFNEDVENFDILFNLFSKSTSETEITGLYGKLITLYDHCKLTITGYTHVYMQRELTRSLSDPELGIRQQSVIYNLEIIK
jgi:hypothetical protein